MVSLACSLFGEAIAAWDMWCLLLGRTVELEIQEDNQATMKVATSGFSAKLRHVQHVHGVNLQSIKEVLDMDGCSIVYCHTDEQAADIFTKALAPHKWQNALDLLGMVSTPPKVLRPG